MNARQLGGRIRTGGGAADHERDAGRQPDRSQVRTHPKAVGRRDVLTTCQTQTSAFQQRPPSGMKERLGPLSGPATIPRTSGPRIPPDLFNLAKGISMAKTARVFLQLAMKSVPVANLLQGAHLSQSRPRETMLQRSYTLCEVDNGSRQDLPTAKPAFSAPENRLGFGSSCCPIFCSMSGRPISSTASNTSPFIPSSGILSQKAGNQTPRQHWAAAEKRPANPLKPFLGLRTGGAA